VKPEKAGLFKSLSKKDAFFLLTLVAVQLVILHGKFVAMVLFDQTTFSAYVDPGPVAHGTILVGSLWFFGLKATRIGSEWKVFLGAAISIAMIVVMSVVRHAIIISVLTLFCYMVAITVVFIDDYFEREMEIDFWKLVFGAGMKGMQFALVLFGIGMALLRVLADSKNESTWGFLTTFFSATIAMVATIYLLVNWVMFPCWRKLAEAYAQEPAHNGALSAQARSMRRRAKKKARNGRFL
tara:strand:+ start:7396 stop:8112 length:717 start_codon:yes stop_codon:yes gene_type:complete